MLLFISLAAAQTTYNLPNAAQHDAGLSTSLGVGVAALRMGPLPSLRGTLSYDHSNVGVYLTSTAYQGVHTEGFDVLSVRYLALANERVRLAPTVTITDHWGISSFSYRATTRLGLAIETGQDTWHWDLSMNFVGWHYRPQYKSQRISRMTVLDTVLTLETGLSYEIKEGHFFRLGLLGPMPSFRYALPHKDFVFELTGATLGTQHLLQLDVRR